LWHEVFDSNASDHFRKPWTAGNNGAILVDSTFRPLNGSRKTGSAEMISVATVTLHRET
jgi:hypothetical protein